MQTIIRELQHGLNKFTNYIYQHDFLFSRTITNNWLANHSFFYFLRTKIRNWVISRKLLEPVHVSNSLVEYEHFSFPINFFESYFALKIFFFLTIQWLKEKLSIQNCDSWKLSSCKRTHFSKNSTDSRRLTLLPLAPHEVFKSKKTGPIFYNATLLFNPFHANAFSKI